MTTGAEALRDAIAEWDAAPPVFLGGNSALVKRIVESSRAVIAATGAGPHADERERLIAILRANPWSMTDYSLEHAAGHILAAGFSYTPEDRRCDYVVEGGRCVQKVGHGGVGHLVGDIPEDPEEPTDEQLCEIMHDAYEMAAVQEGWVTQRSSRVPWATVPKANKRTMLAAVRALRAALEVSGHRHPKPQPTERGQSDA